LQKRTSFFKLFFKSIEPRFIILTKTNKTKEVDKLTSNSLSRAKSIRYTEIP